MQRMIVRVCTVVLAGAFCFLGGFLIGNLTVPEAEAEPVPTQTPYVEQASEVIEQEVEQEKYVLKCENDKLRLYKIVGENEEIERELAVIPQLYPPSDQEELKRGIEVQEHEKALELWENFVG